MLNINFVREYQEDLERAASMVPAIDKLRGKTIMVTGARGLIGSFIIDLLMYCADELELDCQIYGTGRSIESLQKRFPLYSQKEFLHFLKFELGTPILTEEYPKQIDYIIHCAGPGSPSVFMKKASEFLKNTIAGAWDILEYARCSNAKRCLFLSSGEIYGSGDKVFSEEKYGTSDHLSMRSCYPVAKKAAENMWLSYGQDNRIETLIARACHIYGPTALPGESRIANICVHDAIYKDCISLKSEGRQRRSWCYVGDCASGLLTILLNGIEGNAYNVAPDDAYTIAELANMAAEIEGKAVVYDLASEGEARNFNPMENAILSSELLKSLGWKNCYSLRQGIERTLKIMKIQG